MPHEIHMSLATDAAALATELISKYHPHLERASILYVFTSQKRKKCNRVKLATAQKMSALLRFLSSGNQAVEEGADFLMLIGFEEWDSLNAAQKVALVDHELSHMGVREIETKDGIEERWTLLAHEVEEFSAIIERHGIWRRDLRPMAKAIHKITQEQLPLDDERPVRVMR